VLEDREAELPAFAFVPSGMGRDGPILAPTQQDQAAIEPNQIDDGPRRLGIKLGLFRLVRLPVSVRSAVSSVPIGG